MIEAIYQPDRLRIQLRGHAGYAPPGQDIVCAGVSALWFALYSTLEQQEALRHGWLDEEEEHALAFRAIRGYEVSVRTVFETVWRGLVVLEQQYPECVRAVREIT